LRVQVTIKGCNLLASSSIPLDLRKIVFDENTANG
jgi:hypothetical protein